MKKILSVTILAFLISSIAQADCTVEVQEYFKQKHPIYNLQNVNKVKVISANSSMLYYESEIWNETDQDLTIYDIESFFMADFAHIALVNEDDCSIQSLIEVGFD